MAKLDLTVAAAKQADAEIGFERVDLMADRRRGGLSARLRRRPGLRVLHRRREALIRRAHPAGRAKVTSGLQLVTYRAAKFDPLIGLGRVAQACKSVSAACCRAVEVVEKDRRK